MSQKPKQPEACSCWFLQVCVTFQWTPGAKGLILKTIRSKITFICVNLLRKSKTQFFKNIVVKNVTDNKKLLKNY